VKVYLIGRMRGLRNCNREAFWQASAFLDEMGHEVISPLDNPSNKPSLDCVDCSRAWQAEQCIDREAAIRWNLRQLVSEDVEGVALIPGWIHGNGSRLELAVAKSLELEVIDLDDFPGWCESEHEETT